MDPISLVIMLGVLAGALVLFYLSEREKSAVKRKRKRRFRPQWTRKPTGERERRRRR